MNSLSPGDTLEAEANGSVEEPRKHLVLREIGKHTLRVGLTLGLLALLFSQVRWQKVWDAICGADLTLLAWTCVLWIPTQYLQFIKWDLLARDAGDDVSRRDIHRGYWVGFTLGLVTPGRIGQYGRGLALHNCSLSRATGLTVLERG
jgi:uncharacterized membrane protein YbhN (UPF0104 family)